MRKLLLSATILLAFTLIITGCSEPVAPFVEQHILIYEVEGSDPTMKVDITYMSDTGIVKLSDQSLPWTVAIEIGDDFISDAYLKIEVPLDDVFVAYLNGTTDAVPESKKLNDTDVDFQGSGAAEGDIVYKDPATLEYTRIRGVEDSDSLIIESNMFQIGNEDYYLYKQKSLLSSVVLDGVIIDSDYSESERSLSCLVQTPLDY